MLRKALRAAPGRTKRREHLAGRAARREAHVALKLITAETRVGDAWSLLQVEPLVGTGNGGGTGSGSWHTWQAEVTTPLQRDRPQCGRVTQSDAAHRWAASGATWEGWREAHGQGGAPREIEHEQSERRQLHLR